MIKTSTHTTKYMNKNKQEILNLFMKQYREAVQFYVDYLWDNIPKSFVMPKFISTKDIYPVTDLSQRALKCAATQACGMVKAATEKRKRQLYVLRKKTKQGEYPKHLQRAIDKNPIIKPSVPYHLPAELNSICADFEETTGEFNGFMQLKCLGKRFGKIRIPIKYSRHSNKLKNNSVMKNSFLIQGGSVHLRWEYQKPDIKPNGKTRGVDQGITTCITVSDGQVTGNCLHGHDLSSIQKTLARKKKGSKAFRRAQDHRKNYINWSVNQLNLNDVNEIRFEKLHQVGKGQRKSRFLSHFAYTLIKTKLNDVCNNSGVRFIEQSNVYRSQRCSSCGYVHKLNRKGKTFSCRNCMYTNDADMNAALNHEQDLVELPFNFRLQKNNIVGFFWKYNGLYNSAGQAFTVPDVKK